MPHAEMKIPLIDGAIPVKMRAFPMSHGEILILQQLLADLIEKGYVEPADPRHVAVERPGDDFEEVRQSRRRDQPVSSSYRL